MAGLSTPASVPGLAVGMTGQLSASGLGVNLFSVSPSGGAIPLKAAAPTTLTLQVGSSTWVALGPPVAVRPNLCTPAGALCAAATCLPSPPVPRGHNGPPFRVHSSCPPPTTHDTLQLPQSGWSYLGGGDNGMGSDALGGVQASGACPAGTVKTLVNGDGEESSTG